MTRRPIAIAVLVGMAGLVAVSCGETEPAVVGSFTLSGKVTDSRMAGLAIPGAAVRVEAGSASTNTDSLGQYQLSGVPGGRVGITVSAAPSYRRTTIEVDVRSDLTLDIGLPHTGEPPFGGTVWVTPEILGPDDPSSFGSVTHTGRGFREIFDRRANAWITVNAYLFDVQFGERTVEWQFNPEFGSAEAAEAEIEVFGPAMGRLPAALLANLQEVEVNAGQGAFGGNSYNGSILIHTEDPGTRRAVNDGFLEEVFMHEGAHASLDPDHADSPGWRSAQQADGVSISDYAQDFPDREDVAETILPYFAVRYRPERLSAQLLWLMTRTTPNRLAYFDGEDLDMSPYTPQPYVAVASSATSALPAQSYALPFDDPPIPPRRSRR